MNASLWRQSAAVLLGVLASLSSITTTEAALNVTLWDAGERFGESVDLGHRASWRAVPSETLALEPDPLKAASDPGYYGRDYTFAGDAVIENSKLVAVFWSAKGRVVLYSKGGGPDARSGNPASPKASLGAQAWALELLPAPSQSARMTQAEVLRNSGDEVVLKLAEAVGSTNGSAVFSFGRDEIVEVKAAAVRGLRLAAAVEYGVAPAFVGDDLVVDPSKFASASALAIPAENVFVGLLRGENQQLVMTWPGGKQPLTLRLGNDANGRRGAQAIDFEHDGQNLCLAVLSAPGIWRKEILKANYLEKDVALTWKRPFPARWKTQLLEAGVRTTFGFRDQKSQVWRGVPGSYQYPAWFDGETAFYHLSKKVPPKGESIIYFLEGQGSPLGVLSPVDVMKATLGRQVCESILDVAGRKLRTHHRRGGDGVHRACTCGCTEAIQAVFEAGEEVTQKVFVQEALDDMNYFVRRHVERIEEYTRFAAGLSQFLGATATATPALKPFCDNLEEIVGQISQEYSAQKDNMKSLAHADELTRQTIALTNKKSPANLAAYMKLLDAWRAMGGAQDYVLAQCHTITRRVFQEAGLGCLNDPNAVSLAREVRARCRQALRNPDGYEIWADY